MVAWSLSGGPSVGLELSTNCRELFLPWFNSPCRRHGVIVYRGKKDLRGLSILPIAIGEQTNMRQDSQENGDIDYWGSNLSCRGSLASLLLLIIDSFVSFLVRVHLSLTG